MCTGILSELIWTVSTAIFGLVDSLSLQETCHSSMPGPPHFKKWGMENNSWNSGDDLGFLLKHCHSTVLMNYDLSVWWQKYFRFYRAKIFLVEHRTHRDSQSSKQRHLSGTSPTSKLNIFLLGQATNTKSLFPCCQVSSKYFRIKVRHL